MATVRIDQRIPQTRLAGPVPGWRLWRHWVLATTLGELAGFAAPAVAGAAAAAAGLDDLALLAVILPAGLVEGGMLGLAQWWVLRQVAPGITGRAWVVATALAAGLAYLIGMTPATFGARLAELPTPVLLVGGLVLGGMFVLTMGGAQWLVLRRHLARAGWWVAANAVAWPLGVAVPVAALSLLPDGTAPAIVAAVAVVSGLLMGLVVGAITGVTLVRLARQPLLAHADAPGRG